jgi:hypothetical protein
VSDTGTVTAAVIAAIASLGTLIATYISSWRGRLATSRDNEKTLEQQRDQLRSTFAEQREQLNSTLAEQMLVSRGVSCLTV